MVVGVLTIFNLPTRRLRDCLRDCLREASQHEPPQNAYARLRGCGPVSSPRRCGSSSRKKERKQKNKHAARVFVALCAAVQLLLLLLLRYSAFCKARASATLPPAGQLSSASSCNWAVEHIGRTGGTVWFSFRVPRPWNFLSGEDSTLQSQQPAHDILVLQAPPCKQTQKSRCTASTVPSPQSPAAARCDSHAIGSAVEGGTEHTNTEHMTATKAIQAKAIVFLKSSVVVFSCFQGPSAPLRMSNFV